MSSLQLFVIGYNRDHDLGINEHERVCGLTPCPEKKVSRAFSGVSYSIYTDENYDNLWSAGFNKKGSCGVPTEQKLLKQLTAITYFDKHGIKIKKISVSPSSFGSFFISKDNKVYACGNNVRDALGFRFGNDSIYEPTLIPELKDKFIIDIKSSCYYSIAMCSHNDPTFITIITNWARLHSLPQDIINLIVLFMNATKVYATSNWLGGTGHLRNYKIGNKTYRCWNIVDSFKDKNIIKCAVGRYHSMFLEDNGVLWTCGFCKDGRLGLDLNDDNFTKMERMSKNYLFKPTKISFFIGKKIVIKDIKCGSAHNIALDTNGDVYSWGSNDDGQCGQGMDNKTFLSKPKLIESVKEFVIDCIGCGFSHSYVKTVDKRHYLFGDNYYGECITYNDEKKVITPFRVDQIIKSKCNAKEIIQIELGYKNTKVTVSV